MTFFWVNQALEAEFFLGKLFGALEGKRWDALAAYFGQPYLTSPSITAVSDMLIKLADRAITFPDFRFPE